MALLARQLQVVLLDDGRFFSSVRLSAGRALIFSRYAAISGAGFYREQVEKEERLTRLR
jgi:hypothetical protein